MRMSGLAIVPYGHSNVRLGVKIRNSKQLILIETLTIAGCSIMVIVKRGRFTHTLGILLISDKSEQVLIAINPHYSRKSVALPISNQGRQ